MTQNELESPADIGVTGLAVMGRNLARNLVSRGHRVAVHNRTTARMTSLLELHGEEGDFVGSESLEEFVASVRRPRAVIVMVKAGAGTDAVIDELTPLLDEGDIVIDAGNAHPDDTRRRDESLASQGLHFVGMGVSGGEEGALLGPSIMVGGSDEAYERLGPLVESIAAQVEGVPCAAHVGPGAAGHFVKMVHNGIEYADMQLIAECYDLLRSVGGLEPSEIADVFREWNRGDLESYLIEITAEVLGHVDAATGRPFVDVVVDAAEQKGTGRWTVQSALDLGVPVTGIAEATFARSVSGHVGQREAVGAAYPDRPAPAKTPERGPFVDDVRAALYFGKVVAYAQGFDQLRAGGDEHGYDLDLGRVATIWRGGCIIRARFLDRIREAYDDRADLPSLLVSPAFEEGVTRGVAASRRVLAAAVTAGVPTPALATSLAYFDALGRERLPAALIQGLRDFFGAHTYGRVDREGSFHTRWAQDRDEVEG